MPKCNDINLTVVSPTGEQWTFCGFFQALAENEENLLRWVKDNKLPSQLAGMFMTLILTTDSPGDGEKREYLENGWKTIISGVGQFDPNSPWHRHWA